MFVNRSGTCTCLLTMQRSGDGFRLSPDVTLRDPFCPEDHPQPEKEEA